MGYVLNIGKKEARVETTGNTPPFILMAIIAFEIFS
jgi:hypothetical protein